MITSNRTQWFTGSASVAVVLLLLGITGCGSHSAASRATLYESIDDLARDSIAIVVGTATGQRYEDDATITTFEVSQSPTNPELAAHVDEDGSTVDIGDVIDVRQMAGSTSSGTSPMLQTGQEYLLFLTPSMLVGDAATHFYITGAEAGLYVRDGEVFRRVVLNTGDTLPESITPVGNGDDQ